MSIPTGILGKYAPQTLSDVVGQPHVVTCLKAFVKSPTPNAFIFHGPSGVGKTAAALALAHDLGCDPDWGGILEIPSGTQNGKEVADLLRTFHLKPLMGSGWKVAIINEADRMTEQAEAIWLDSLERLPPQTVVIFTTNNLHRLTDRFRRRCEVYAFDASGADFRRGLQAMVRRVWKGETGKRLSRVPDDLGKFELASSDYSIALAIQQIMPYARDGQSLPSRFQVPLVRSNASARETAPETPVANHAAHMRPNASSKKVSPDGGKDEGKPAPTRAFCLKCRKWIRKGEMARESAVGTVHAGC